MDLLLHVRFDVHFHESRLDQRKDILKREFFINFKNTVHKGVLGMNELRLLVWIFP
jgi:hypothetical protein